MSPDRLWTAFGNPKAFVKDFAVIFLKGISSGNRLVAHMMDNKYWQPDFTQGSVPTQATIQMCLDALPTERWHRLVKLYTNLTDVTGHTVFDNVRFKHQMNQVTLILLLSATPFSINTVSFQKKVDYTVTVNKFQHSHSIFEMLDHLFGHQNFTRHW